MKHKLHVLYCRTFQFCMKLANYFVPYRTPECLQGAGSVKKLGVWLMEKGIDDVLVVTGSGMLRRGQADGMLQGFAQQGIRYVLQTYDNTDPTDADVEAGFAAYRGNHCRAIVALGGGSRIDCAKAIAAKAARPKKTVAQLQGVLRGLRPVPTLIAVPTTAGAGSENTVAAVITDTKTHRKAAINDPALMPRCVVLDAELTASLPSYTTAITGMDALTHAVEAYINRTYNTKAENDLAKQAVRLIHANIRTACETGSDLQAREHMQQGAFYAGRAFTRGCVGYVHALGHTLGSLYGVPHGLAMAVLLPHVLRAYGDAVQAPLAELSQVCGIEGGAEGFIIRIEEMNRTLGLPEKFDMVKDDDIPQMIAWVKKEAHPLYPVPVIWSDGELEAFIRRVCQ